MERGSKRKAALAASSPDNRAAKRQKTPDPISNATPGTEPDSTRDIGLRFVEQLRAARDKYGNLVATDFLTLPSRKDYPDYFEHTLLPLAIDILEAKLQRKEYPSVSAFESDIKRMVQNAKDYNESSSEIVQNAERIRKLTHNFMSKNNPAHKDKNYQALATPLPTQQIRLKSTAQPSPVPAPVTVPNAKSDADRASRRKSTTHERGRSASTSNQTPAIESTSDGQESPFDGKTFQQAQDQIITELLEAKESGGELKTYEPFANLPTRKLEDYYKIIKDPTSLKGVLKKIHGIHGRHENTGTTDFKSWEAFENEVKKIWENARYYNEDGSDISELSIVLEEHFNRRLADAKKVIAEPTQPTLKLNMTKPTPLKLRLGSHKASPGPQQDPQPQAGSPHTGVSVDQSALERQKQQVEAAVNGQKSPQADSTDAKATTRSPSTASQPTKSNGPAGSPILPNGVKSEAHQSQSPAPGQSMPSSMLPPSRLVNGTSPHPFQSPVPVQPAYTPPPPMGPDSKWRQPGKDASDALIPTVSINTHPSLGVPKPANVTVSAHPRLTQQSITLNLPQSHYLLQFSVTLSPSLSSGRAYKLFVSGNGQRLTPVVPPGSNDFGGSPNGGPSKRTFFDVKLIPGVNKLEAECVAIATPPKNGPGPGMPPLSATPGNTGLEGEKVTCFVHLLK